MNQEPEPPVAQPNNQPPAIEPPKPGEVLTASTPGQPPAPEAKKPTKKRSLIISLIIILLAVAVGAYVFFFRDKAEAPAPSTPAVTTTPESTKPAADTIIYYSQAKDTEPYKIYSVSVDGSGEAKTIYTLDKKEKNNYYTIHSAEVAGQTVVFDTNDGVYVSQDAGKTFTKIYDFSSPDPNNPSAITNVKLTPDGKQVMVAHLTSVANSKVTNVVKIMDLDGKNTKNLHTFDKAGIRIYNYNPDTQQLVYSEGCYFCDGGPSFPRLIDLKTGKDKQLFSIDTNKLVYNAGVVSKDGKKYIYYTGTLDSLVQQQSGGVGWQGAPPYKVIEYDIASGKSTTLATIGKLHEKDTNGKYKEYTPTLGFTSDGLKPYYSVDKKLYVVSGGKSTLAFEANNNIAAAPYISADEVIVDAYKLTNNGANSEFFFYRFDVPTNKATTLLNVKGSFFYIAGVTTK